MPVGCGDRAGVAETAVQRREQAIGETEGWLFQAEQLIKRHKFGNNHDGGWFLVGIFGGVGDWLMRW